MTENRFVCSRLDATIGMWRGRIARRTEMSSSDFTPHRSSPSCLHHEIVYIFHLLPRSKLRLGEIKHRFFCVSRTLMADVNSVKKPKDKKRCLMPALMKLLRPNRTWKGKIYAYMITRWLTVSFSLTNNIFETNISVSENVLKVLITVYAQCMSNFLIQCTFRLETQRKPPIFDELHWQDTPTWNLRHNGERTWPQMNFV